MYIESMKEAIIEINQYKKNAFMDLISSNSRRICSVSIGYIDRVNRTLFLASGITCTFALGSLGLFFFVKDLLEVNVSLISWIPMASIILFNIGYYSGIGPVPYIIPGELFPVKVKGIAVNLGIIVENFFGFIVGLVFCTLNDTFGNHGTFLIFGTYCIVGSISVFCLIPKTRGKTLEEVQTELQRKKK